MTPVGLALSGVQPDMEPVGAKTHQVVLFLGTSFKRYIRKAGYNENTTSILSKMATVDTDGVKWRQLDVALPLLPMLSNTLVNFF